MKIGDRRFLVFSSADGDRSTYRQWIADDHQRSFDLALYVYHGSIDDHRVELIREQKGFKYPNFHHLSEHYDLSGYDAVWIIDDDIEIASTDIERLFRIFTEHRLLMAQPAYASDSATAWNLLLVDPHYQLRFSNFVENGVALFSAPALERCVNAMQDIKTGFGAEFLFMHLIQPAPEQVAVIDAVICRHPPATSSLDRHVPRKHHEKDASDLMKKYRFDYFTPRISGGIRSRTAPP